jgi:hypothetical protein
VADSSKVIVWTQGSTEAGETGNPPVLREVPELKRSEDLQLRIEMGVLVRDFR